MGGCEIWIAGVLVLKRLSVRKCPAVELVELVETCGTSPFESTYELFNGESIVRNYGIHRKSSLLPLFVAGHKAIVTDAINI